MHAEKNQEALMRLGLLLQLQRRARRAEAVELPYIFVNETRVLVPYRQAVYWQRGEDGSWSVGAVSGLAAPDAGAPFVQWLEAVCAAVRRLSGHEASRPLAAADLPEDLAGAWSEWLPAAGRWLPLYSGNRPAGALALFRDETFSEGELELLGHLSESFGQCLPRQDAGKSLFARWKPGGRRRHVWLLAALCVALLFPARQSVLAPAEVIPLQPAHIRAPLDGVIESINVTPNQAISSGQVLLRLEDGELRTRLAVSRKSLEIARAELQQTQQMGLADPRAKVRLPMLQGRVEQLAAEADLVQTQLDRVDVASPVDGIAVFDDPDAWLGRPVSVGQKIMEVADPAKVQLQITLPMSETLPLGEGERVLFFPNISPHAPLSASLSFIGYMASETPEAGIAFTLRAAFAPKDAAPRLGLRGTAKLYGTRMPLGIMLLRRPLVQLRQWLGI